MIRPGRADDVEALARLWHEAWHDAHATLVPRGLVEQRTVENFVPRLQALIEREDLLVWGEPPGGFVAVAEDELYQLMVGAAARGTGAAAALLRAGRERIREAGHGVAWLDCAVGNERARCFYEREGWRIVREETIDLSTPAGAFPVRSWRMETET